MEGEHKVSPHGERTGRRRQDADGDLGSNEWTVGVSGWGYRERDEAGQGESKQRAVPEATAAAGSNWYTSQLYNAHSRSLCHPPPFTLTSNCRFRPSPLVWIVVKAVVLTPELDPLATEESLHRAVCQGLLIWAR